MGNLTCGCQSGDLRCHTCRGRIRKVLDGEEWCDQCEKYQRPRAHGWANNVADQDLPEPCVMCKRPAVTEYEGEASCGSMTCELQIQVGLDFADEHDGSGC